MDEQEKHKLREMLSVGYELEEEPEFWIVASKGSGQVVATVLLSEGYHAVRQQLGQAGVGLVA